MKSQHSLEMEWNVILICLHAQYAESTFCFGFVWLETVLSGNEKCEPSEAGSKIVTDPSNG